MVIPIRTVSEPNSRGHWARKYRRSAPQRMAARLYAIEHLRFVGFPCTVTLTRVAPRKLDDDNLRGALKACRDGIADWLGVDDRDERVRWEYGQERGKPREYAVRVEVRRA